MKKYLVSQFRRPNGLLGRVAGRIMAHRSSNRKRNRWTVDLLGLQPSERVLEIGFGPGIALARAADCLKHGQVVGLDHSRTMYDMATRRNRRAIAAGRISLVVGSVEELDRIEEPAIAGPFEHIFGLNVVMFWKDPVRVFEMLRQRLCSNGQLAFTFQPRLGALTDEAALSAASQMAEQLRDAGFRSIRLECLQTISPMAVCVIARQQ
jgi:SAM-dependent methyltransferase